jgi:hypothetical protein
MSALRGILFVLTALAVSWYHRKRGMVTNTRMRWLIIFNQILYVLSSIYTLGFQL